MMIEGTGIINPKIQVAKSGNKIEYSDIVEHRQVDILHK